MRCVVFDMDGTLLDSSRIKIDLWLDFIESHGHSREDALYAYNQYNGLSRKVFISKIFKSLGGCALSDSEYNVFNEYLSKRYNPSFATLFPDTKRALSLLKEHKTRLFVSSGAPQFEVDRFIEYFKIGNYFNAAFGSQNDFKKGEEHFSRILSVTGASKKETVFIGNDEKDFDMAREFGIDYFMANREAHQEPLLEIAQCIVSLQN